MTPMWAPRHGDLRRACVVSPHVFAHLVDHLWDVVAPAQHCLETEVSQRHVHRYLAGLLSHSEVFHRVSGGYRTTSKGEVAHVSICSRGQGF